MVIQHNLSAINANRQLGLNNKSTSLNLEKLSSGYRVNRAADDAAGLAISEKMRGQIRGLNMASQNCDNGISLIQTAEGGLNETHAILQRMRELAVQSSNGTYHNEVDRENLDKEARALISELDRIASATHYNNIDLLNGSLGGQTVDMLEGGTFPALPQDGTYEDGSMAALAEKLKNMGFDLKNTLGAVYNLNGNVDITSFDSSFDGESLDIIVVKPGDGSANRLAISVGGQTFNGVLMDTGGSNIPTANGLDVNLNANTYAFFDDDGLLISTIEIKASSPSSTINNAMKNNTDYMSGVIAGITLGAATTDGTDNITQLFPNTSAIGDKYFKEGDAAFGAIVADEKSQIIFQIGANGSADQRVGLHVDVMSSVNLGEKIPTEWNQSGSVRDVSLNPREAANDAIDVIDAAINQVSGTRADLGALQNRLEHTLNNLGVTAENLTAAESSIRDVDMAREMMEFTKNSILVQSSQAMLAQANQLPQGVLSLLR